MLIKVKDFVFPTNFIVLDMEEDHDVPLILGRPFMNTARASIDVCEGKLTLRVEDHHVQFDVFKKQHSVGEQYFRLDITNTNVVLPHFL